MKQYEKSMQVLSAAIQQEKNPKYLQLRAFCYS